VPWPLRVGAVTLADVSRRLAAVAALAVVVGCAGCDTDALGSARDAASSAGGQVTSQAKEQLASQLDQMKAAAAAEAKRQATEVAAQAQKKLQQQIASGTTAVKAAADTAVKSAASAAASLAPAPAAVASVVPEATHTVRGTFTSTERVDVSGGSVPCATLANVVGQAVSISTGTATVTGTLTACAWSAPGVLGSSPVFSLVVEKVPEASSYDISIGDRSWKVPGTTLAASGWQVALT
jgi:hypothetical protein